MPEKGTTSEAARIGSGPELLVELDRGAAGRCGPSSRTGCARRCARAVCQRMRACPPPARWHRISGISRRLVVDAYAQLLAEGYLVARRGAGTFVADAAGAVVCACGRARARGRPRSTSSRATPTSRPSRAGPWLRALRETLREAPDRAFGYPDARGAGELRRALSEHLRRVRGVVADPRSIVVCAGAAQGFALLGAGDRGRGASPSRIRGCRRIARSSPLTARRWSRSRSTSRGRACTSSPAWREAARDRRGARDARAPVADGRRRSRRRAARRCWRGRPRPGDW